MAFGGFLVRQFTKFKNRKIQFMKALSENLYFRNLDNDAGVFHHLLDAAEEEEVKEAVLAYHFLRTAERPLTAAELDRESKTGSSDGGRLSSTSRSTTGSASAPAASGRRRRCRTPTAVSLDEAKRRLDQTWDDLFTYHAPPSAKVREAP